MRTARFRPHLLAIVLGATAFLAAVGTGVIEASQVGAGSISESYDVVSRQIIEAALDDEEGYRKLAFLTDRIGHRLSGSRALERAVDWAAQTMRGDGLENVVTPAVKVPRWIRGRECAEIVAPERIALAMLGLGGSVGTPEDGVSAEVLPVASFDELGLLGRAAIEGKIVLYNVPYQGYGRTVAYRARGASAAASYGAVGVLIRSVGPVSLQTPHTGSLQYEESVPRIPAAALTIEGASLIQRLVDSGEPVRVRLFMQARAEDDADSANVIGEIPGREIPHEVVVLGGHLDSWDVGQGAHDDGAGSVAAMQAVALLRDLGLRPRRTVRVVLWTNEENGLRGGAAYRDWVGSAVEDHVAAIEMDMGAERPTGFGLGIPGLQTRQDGEEIFARALEIVGEIGRLLESIGAGEIVAGGGGADIGPIMRAGVPGLGLRTIGEHYFDWHHTEADTLDKIDPENFRKNVASLAVMAYVLADMPDRLVR